MTGFELELDNMRGYEKNCEDFEHGNAYDNKFKGIEGMKVGEWILYLGFSLESIQQFCKDMETDCEGKAFFAYCVTYGNYAIIRIE